MAKKPAAATAAKPAEDKPPKGQSLPATQPKGGALVAHDDDFSQYAGQGMENVTAGDILIPRIAILQDLSPQLKERKPEFIAGAAVGDICDVGLGEVYKDGLLFVPVYYVKQWLEWAPRASGKGLVNIHDDDSILEKCRFNEKNQPLLGPNLISETAQWYGLNLNARGRRSFLPMSSTALKRSKRWMGLATSEELARADGSTFNPPLFYRAYYLTTAEESNNEGDWIGWKIERGPSLPELGTEAHGSMDWRRIRDIAVSFRDQLVKGKAKADLASMQGDTDGDARRAGGQGGQGNQGGGRRQYNGPPQDDPSDPGPGAGSYGERPM